MASSSPDPRDAPGWYGKLSSLGDFAQRRLPPHWVKACDAWLSDVLRSGREQLGARFLDVYLTAPVLRFAWAPGVVDTHWWFGLLMPSCDSVGRYFPLLIAQHRARPPEDRIALDHLELWLDHLAHAAVHTLSDGGGSVDDLEAALHDAPRWPAAGRGAAAAIRRDAGNDHFEFARAAALSQWLPTLAAQQLGARLAGCSLWWRVGESGGAEAADIVPGLPDGERFVALLRGA